MDSRVRGNDGGGDYLVGAAPRRDGLHSRPQALHFLRIFHTVIPFLGALFKQFFFVVAHLILLLFVSLHQSTRET